MTRTIQITLPKLGESIVSATVVQWFKKAGDRIALDEPLLEVSTDKVNSEIPSPAAGILVKILAFDGQEVEVGAPLAVLQVEGGASHAAPEIETPSPSHTRTGSNDILSPAVLRLLQEKGIPFDEIGKIPHTGEGGRLTKKDVENYKRTCPAAHISGNVERVKMSALRKAIADNMVRSFYEAPHASLMTEVDVTPIMHAIQAHKADFLQKHGVKLSITAFVARAIARAVKQYPLINASLEQDTIVVKHFVNLGIAVSVDQGVMVPVVRGCGEMSLPKISQEIASLADKARNHKLTTGEVQEGTLTMTNFGMTGVMVGIPIIRYPEVAIVGLGAVTKKVVAMPDDTTAVRSVMWVSLTFDHRVLDGLYGCGFLNALKTELEKESASLY